MKIIMETKQSISILCPNCKKHIEYYEIIKLLRPSYINEFIDKLALKKCDEYIINNAKNTYSIIQKICEKQIDYYCYKKSKNTIYKTNIELYKKYILIARKIILKEDDLPIPETFLIDNILNFNINKKYYISLTKSTYHDTIYFVDFFNILLNYRILDINIYNKIIKQNSNEINAFCNNYCVDFCRFVEKLIESSYKNINDMNNKVMGKCKNCRYGLIIDSSYQNSKNNELKITNLKQNTIKNEYECNSCHQKYCSKCLCSISSQYNHICHPEDVKTWKELSTNSIPCPCCGAYIYKSSGCDQMFCTNCHNNFNYHTGKIINGYIHNPHRIEWLTDNTHYTNTDISEIEKYSSIKFNRLIQYHNILVTKYLNYTVIKRQSYNYLLIDLILSYYNDIESYSLKTDFPMFYLIKKYNLNKFIDKYVSTYKKSFKYDVLSSIYSMIIELIYSNLLKIVNESNIYVTDNKLNDKSNELYNNIINKLLEYNDLLIMCDKSYNIKDILYFLFDPLPVEGFENIAYINLDELKIDNIDDLFDIINDLNDSNKIYDKNQLNVYCDYNDITINTALLKFLGKFKFPRKNIKQSYYLSKTMIDNLLKI
jgi:hypothetical protein